MHFKGLFQELKRRNVFRVATAYTIAGWLIIQICATTFPFLNLPEWLVTAVIMFVLIGFPLSLIFAWAFELTPEGLKKSKEVEITESVTNRTGKKLNGLIITVLSMAVIFLLVERVFFAEAAFLENQTEANFETASIAVLPFVNMSGDEENEYFSDGLSEELLNALAKVEDMKVAGRTSSFKFKGQNENLSLIGEELKVGHILEGSVRKSGNRVRITTQLIKVEDGYHMWSETFDRELTAGNIFEIQEEISREVLNELKIRLLEEDEAELAENPTNDIEAYNAYLKGIQYEATRLESDLRLAIRQYEEAVRIDPSFAKAYARMAIAYELLSGYGDLSEKDRRRLVRENVDQALFLNQNIPEAYAALGLFYMSNGETQKSIDALNKAIELNPNYGLAYTWLGNSYRFKDQQKTIESYLRAYELDPLENTISNNYAFTLVLTDRFKEALEAYKKQIRNEPKRLFAYYRLAEIQAYYFGNLEEAFKVLFEANEMDPGASLTMAYIGLLAINIEMEEYAEVIFRTMQETYPDNQGTLMLEFWGLYYKREYENLRVLIQREFESGIFQEGSSDAEMYLIYNTLKSQERFDILDALIEKAYPELLEDEIKITEANVAKAFFWGASLRDRGEQESFEALIEPLCTFGEGERIKLRDNPNSDDFLYPALICADFQEDREAFLSVFDEYKLKQNLLIANFDFLMNDSFFEFARQDIPAVKVYRERIKLYMAEEYRKSVAFLKTQGVWENEWPDERTYGSN